MPLAGQSICVNIACAVPTLLPTYSTQEFDGASKSNPGPAGFGCVIYDEASGVELTRMAQYMGHFHTNNQVRRTAGRDWCSWATSSRKPVLAKARRLDCSCSPDCPLLRLLPCPHPPGRVGRLAGGHGGGAAAGLPGPQGAG